MEKFKNHLVRWKEVRRPMHGYELEVNLLPFNKFLKKFVVEDDFVETGCCWEVWLTYQVIETSLRVTALSE